MPEQALSRAASKLGVNMGKIKISYYVVVKGRGYWRPKKEMRELGFERVKCGPDGPAAWAVARTWALRWQQAQLSALRRQRGAVKQGFPSGLDRRSVPTLPPHTGVGAQGDAYPGRLGKGLGASRPDRRRHCAGNDIDGRHKCDPCRYRGERLTA